MTLGAPVWFWGLVTIPILALLFARAEQRGAARLREFVSPRLLPQLSATVNRARRILRFGLLMLALAFAIVSLAQPRWGYIYEDVKRKGLDLLFAVDTSRSMLSNDVQPNRLDRVKLATQDLINQLQGDRVGLVAFAGRAFLQAPLTIDYEAAVESINDLDTKTIPEGGTNISEAINLAAQTFGKSAAGNRALIIFTDGEELSGDAVKAAKTAGDAGMKIFTVGVGTPQGSLIPVTGDDGGTEFVKDSAGQVVKSKLDEKRLEEIAKATGGFYLHLDDGPRTMSQLYRQGLATMKAAEIDARLSRRPIERYQWPLGAAMIALTMSILVRERKTVRARTRAARRTRIAVPATAFLLICIGSVLGAASTGLNLYQGGKYNEAYQNFQQDLQSHPDSSQKEKIEFDAGAAAFKMGDFNKALQSFSDALLSPDKRLQENSHFNLGRTLEDRADMAQTNDGALKDLTDAASHYEGALQLNPRNEAAQANLEEVKKKIARLKEHPKQKPTPPPQQQQQQKKNQQQNGGGQSQDQEQQSQSQSNSGGKDQNQQQQNQQTQSQNQSDANQNQNSQDNSQRLAKNEAQKDQQSKSSENPSPAQSNEEDKDRSASAKAPADKQSAGKQEQPDESPSPAGNEDQAQSPSANGGQDENENAAPSATPNGSPQKKLMGEIKGANGEKKPQSPQQAAIAEHEPEQDGQMNEKQAELLLQSMKDEEARVQLDERRVRRRVYNDW
ncbi:MAG: VWA domain-containing protein [Verrucomicrobia bacterium]|nr:VWA domain-containing protein [Verrucomicrobiota bacterium]